MTHPKFIRAKDILNKRNMVFSSNFVFTNGCFDIFHAGHAKMLNYIKENSAPNSQLVVGINSDESVKENKGPNRPIISEYYRAYLVACHEAVSHVFIFDEPDVADYITQLHPKIWFKGGDYDLDTLNPKEVAACKEKNTEIKFVPFLGGFSTTKIIEEIKSK